MKFVDYNFVSDEDAAKILESYGYTSNDTEKVEESSAEDAPAEEEISTTEEVVEESSDVPACVITRDAGVFGLHEDVEEIDGDLYIRVSSVDEELYGSLEENESSVLESVDYEEDTYDLGDVFEDEKSGDLFVQMVKS